MKNLHPPTIKAGGRKMTEPEIITYFCIIDDVLKSMGIKDDPQEKVSNSEVLTMGVIAHISFAGNYKQTLEMLKEGFKHLFPYVPSLSRFSRRMHKLKPYLQLTIQRLGLMTKKPKRFIIDSKPIKVCENIRISRAKVLKGEQYRGYIPSKREYFYGYKLHALIDEMGLFREVYLLEGRLHDLEGMCAMSFYGAEGSEVIGDRAYTNYGFEDELKEEGIKLNPVRRANESRYEGQWLEYFKKSFRRLIETAFSVVYRFLGLRPYAPTKEGIVLKVFMAVLAFNLYRGFRLGLWQ